MEQQNTHELNAAVRADGTTLVSCESCGYQFTASLDAAGGIDLDSRDWVDRGDRSVRHRYIVDATTLETMVLNALYDAS